MNKKMKMLQTLTIYFMEKGSILSKKEYKKQKDKPIKTYNIVRVFSSWGMISKMIARNFPKEYAIIKEGLNPIPTEVEAEEVGLIVEPEADEEDYDE